jgi:hypothetical protein
VKPPITSASGCHSSGPPSSATTTTIRSEHLYAARDAPALGARLRRIAESGARARIPRWCCPATASPSAAATRFASG